MLIEEGLDLGCGVYIFVYRTEIAQKVAKQSHCYISESGPPLFQRAKSSNLRATLAVYVDGICLFEAKVRVCLLTILEQVDVVP